MFSFVKNYENQIYALMRITTGFMFLCHGASKFMVLQEPARPWHIQWIAAAYWMSHFPRGILPILNRGDAAALYSFVFLYISAKGTGIWGLGKN